MRRVYRNEWTTFNEKSKIKYKVAYTAYCSRFRNFIPPEHKYQGPAQVRERERVSDTIATLCNRQHDTSDQQVKTRPVAWHGKSRRTFVMSHDQMFANAVQRVRVHMKANCLSGYIWKTDTPSKQDNDFLLLRREQTGHFPDCGVESRVSKLLSALGAQ